MKVEQLVCVVGGLCLSAAAQNMYTDTVLVANDAAYEPLVMVDPLLGNGWGLALRPPGAGGHFWISNANTGTTTTYVGDVHDAQGRFQPLGQDSLRVVDIPIGNGVRFDGTPVTEISIPTGQVYNYSTSDFVVSGEGITAASKFIFVTGDGTISGWTEWRDAQGVLHRQTRSVITVDESQGYDDERLQYTGVAVTDYASHNRLYVANWTGERVDVYDHEWHRVALPAGRFHLPSQGEAWRAWNIQYFRTGPQREGRLWVTFNKAEDPWEEYPELGAVAEFDLDGNFIRRLRTSLDTDPAANSELRDPWGLAIAPANFGPLSGALLVANFGDGTIAAFDLASGNFIDFVRGDGGEPLIVDGIWGITFGNGVGLGDLNALYYAAGPNGEADGTFGTVRYTPDTCPNIQAWPQPAGACLGGSVRFDVAVPSPVRLAMRWSVERSPGVWSDLADGPLNGTGAVVSGSDSPTLRIAGVDAGATGMYRCTVSNACGSVSTPAVLLSVCVGDFNCDGGVDGADVGAFFDVWDAGLAGADVNADGGVDGADVAAFYAAWEAGC